MRNCCLCWLRKTKEKTSSPKLLSYKFKKDEFLLLKPPQIVSKNFSTAEHKSHYKSPSCASSCNFNFKSVLYWYDKVGLVFRVEKIPTCANLALVILPQACTPVTSVMFKIFHNFLNHNDCHKNSSKDQRSIAATKS